MTPLMILCVFIPFFGTILGSGMVFFLKKEINPKVQKILMGFAAGVMIAASIWSLLEPAIHSFDPADFKSWLVPAIGFLVGVGFLLLLDIITPHMHKNDEEEGIKTNKLSKSFKMVLAVTIHNIPEGLAAGIVIAGALNGSLNEQAMLVLAIGLAIQNFPEGAIISMPLKEEGQSKVKAFLYGSLSGVVEPIASLIAIGLTALVTVILPYTLAFAAGAMIYVVVEELIPEMSAGEHSNIGVVLFACGFTVMMALDVALG